MPFIHDYNLIFIHIPKNGGTSVENHFDVWREEKQFSCNDKEHKISWVSLNEEPIKIEKNILTKDYGTENFIFSLQHYIPYFKKDLDTESWEKYRKFTIVRDPYTRAISEYCYRHHGKKILMWDNNEFSNWFKNFCCDGVILDHYLPQIEYFNHIKYNKILRFENLQDDFRSMCKEYNIKDIELPHINKSVGNVPDFKKQLNKQSIDLINERYFEDFEYFNYKFL